MYFSARKAPKTPGDRISPGLLKTLFLKDRYSDHLFKIILLHSVKWS